jgi:hypothetical protein
MAHEEVCRCSCGGKNHGVLKRKGGEQPQRMAKIDGERYKLEAIADGREIVAEAEALNRSVGWMRVVDGWSSTLGGEQKRFPYHYQWRETDKGAPARVKRATFDQIEKWPELKAYVGCSTHNRPFLLWVKEEMPPDVYCEVECERCDQQRIKNFING